MKLFHASKFRFEKFDFDKIGTGQDLNRHAWGIYLGEPEAVEHYLNDYAYLADIDRSICGGNGIAYQVNVPSSIKIVDWESEVPNSLLNNVALNLLKEIGGENALSGMQKSMARAGMDLNYVDDIGSFINELSEKAYEFASEEGECACFIEQDHYTDFITRKILGDYYTKGDYDDDFTVDNKFLELLKPFSEYNVSIQRDFSWENLYNAVKQVFSEHGEPSTAAKKASEFMVEHAGIDCFDAPCVYGRSKSRELVVISQEAASRMRILEIEHLELSSPDNGFIADRSLDI
jgi:hypothetical protein